RGLALGRLTEFAGELVKLVPQACRGRVLDRRFAGLGPIRARSFHRSLPRQCIGSDGDGINSRVYPERGLAQGFRGCPLWVRSGHMQRTSSRSALPAEATSNATYRNVRFGPKADSCTAAKIVIRSPRRLTVSAVWA